MSNSPQSDSWRWIPGGVTAAADFVAGSIYVGIKKSNKDRKDLALIFSKRPAVGAAAFTTNKVKAAPVRVSMAHLRSVETRAILANSGNANACTGVVGIEHAKTMARAAADSLGIKERQVMVCSTGRIGVLMPIERIERAVLPLAESLSPKGGRKAAKAIMTSDTFPKECAVEFELDGRTVRVGGIAKGAGMIDPNMATMLSFLTTDATIDKRLLQNALSIAVEQSYNRITVDGDMSTNDTVILLANGASGHPGLVADSKGMALFQAALNEVTRRLAFMIVEDGEGVSKFVEVRVHGAATHQDARNAAEAIANSTLVKCAWGGNDPNWGRILDAVGYSSARLREEMVDIYYDGVVAVKNGVPSDTPPAKLKNAVSKKRICVTVDLHLGEATYTVYTTDLTTEYVVLNQSE